MIRSRPARSASAVRRVLLVVSVLSVALTVARTQETTPSLRDRYEKREVMIPMRDGVHLFTAIYLPRDRSQVYPFLMKRTPYTVAPYGADEYPSALGPNSITARDGYLFVNQDVRGRGQSLGEFVNVRPHRSVKESASEIDESSDTYDTIEWLLKHVEGHNGKVGMYGISYPGFYAATGMIDAHPALSAVSPQAPVADWFFDDFHHHGTFFLPHAFNFFLSFGVPRPLPTRERPAPFDHGTADGYRYFLGLGPLSNAAAIMSQRQVAYWDEIVAHPNYDEYWQERNLLPDLNHVAPAVMTVGGWYDAEDLYGALQVYRSIERQNQGTVNTLVMGPWEHGGWSRGNGERLGGVDFRSNTSLYYQEQVEAPFFRKYLKNEGDAQIPEALMFDTGAMRWGSFAQWPPDATRTVTWYLAAQSGWSAAPPSASPGDSGFDSFVSDPDRPVPYTQEIAIGMTSDYMNEDQRFASRRPDVLVYRSGPLPADLTLAGPLVADLCVSTTAGDADWIVKLIDVCPERRSDPTATDNQKALSGAEILVRSEAFRGRFRNGYDHPEPFVPGQPARVSVPLQDVYHTFGRGHEIMIQIQSTWFPVVDRNPQKYVDNIFLARPEDFTKAEHRVLRTAEHPSALRFHVLE